MLVFRMLCRITQSSDAHRTESVTAIDHEQTMGVNFKVLDQKQPNIFDRISLFWNEELQGHPEQLNESDLVNNVREHVTRVTSFHRKFQYRINHCAGCTMGGGSRQGRSPDQLPRCFGV